MWKLNGKRAGGGERKGGNVSMDGGIGRLIKFSLFKIFFCAAVRCFYFSDFIYSFCSFSQFPLLNTILRQICGPPQVPKSSGRSHLSKWPRLLPIRLHWKRSGCKWWIHSFGVSQPNGLHAAFRGMNGAPARML